MEYSATFGSFIRGGDYPLEAEYIFSSVEELQQWCEKNQGILHKGLFKIVEADEDNKQALFWIIEKNNKFVFEKLITANNIQELLKELEQKLDEEIKDRKEIDENFVNTFTEFKNQIEESQKELLESSSKLSKDLNSTINKLNEILGDSSDKFNSLEKIEKIIQEINSKFPHIFEDLVQIRYGVGLDGSGRFSPDQETNYLKEATSVMNALRTLDSVLSNKETALLSKGYYDSESQSIVLEFENEDLEPIKIPASDLIIEWNTKNSKSISLSKEKEGSLDILSADVIVSEEDNNAVKVLEDGIYVEKSTADNIIFEEETSIKEKINTLETIFDWGEY